jgi:hypothetical protein
MNTRMWPDQSASRLDHPAKLVLRLRSSSNSRHASLPPSSFSRCQGTASRTMSFWRTDKICDQTLSVEQPHHLQNCFGMFAKGAQATPDARPDAPSRLDRKRQPAQNLCEHGGAGGNMIRLDPLVLDMACAVAARNEDHPAWADFCEMARVVTGG